MFNLQKIGRDLLSASSVADAVEVVSYQRPDKATLTNLKLQTVLQSAKANFREQPPSPSKCRRSLVEVIVTLISRGQEFSKSEMTDIFFAATQLFNLQDWHIRRLIYVMLDTMKNGVIGIDEAFMLTAPLQKDLEKGEAAHRSRAIRRMCRIDPTIAAQIEPQIKNALLDTNPEVSSAALVYGEFLLKHSPHLVHRWGQQVASAIKQNKDMAQAHACRLLFAIKAGDRMALMRQVKSSTDGRPQNSPLGDAALVYTLQQAEDILKKYPGQDAAFEEQVFAYLQAATQSPSNAVAFQAAKSLTSIASTKLYPGLDCSGALETLKCFLGHVNPTFRFGAIRALHKLSQTMPGLLVTYMEDLQAFHREQIDQPTLAILAVNTLLNAGNEDQVPGLLNTLSMQRSVDMPEAFKLDTIRSVAALAKKYPKKYDTFLMFLNQQARMLASLEYKELLIQTVITIGEVDGTAHQKVLDALCEFIEDLEYPILTAYIIEKISEMLCDEQCNNPETYVRFIFNRLILEDANVRASSLAGLAMISQKYPSLKDSIGQLLALHGSDQDDGIREMTKSFGLESDDVTCASDTDLIDGEDLMEIKSMYWTMQDQKEEKQEVGVHLEQHISTEPETIVAVDNAKSPSELISLLQEALPSPKLHSVVKKLPAVPMTSAEAEYIVTAKGSVIKGDCAETLLAFEFSVTNTMEEMILMNVSPQITSLPDGIEPLTYLPIDMLPIGESKTIYFLLKIDQSATFAADNEVKIPIRFAYTVNEEGYVYDDEYDVEPLKIHQSSL